MTEKQNKSPFSLGDLTGEEIKKLSLGIQDLLQYISINPNPVGKDLIERFEGVDRALEDLEAQKKLISKVMEALKSEKQRLGKLESDQLKQRVDEQASDAVGVEGEYEPLNSDIFPNLYAFNDVHNERFCLVNKETQKILDGMWFKGRIDDLLFPDILNGVDGKTYIIITNLITPDGKKNKITQLKELKETRSLNDSDTGFTNFIGDSFIITSDGQKYLCVEQTRKYIQLSENTDFQMGVGNADIRMGVVILGGVDGDKKFETVYSYKDFYGDGLEQRLPAFSAIMLVPGNKRCALCIDEDGAIAIGDIFKKDIVGGLYKLRGDWSREEPLRKLVSKMDMDQDVKEKFLKNLVKREIFTEADATKAMKDFTI